MPRNIFVSHDFENSFLTSLLRQALTKRDFNVMPNLQDIESGEDWQDKLLKELNASDSVVVVLTPDSVKSPWVAAEIGAALALQKRLIAIASSDVKDADIPGPLRARLVRTVDRPGDSDIADEDVATAVDSIAEELAAAS